MARTLERNPVDENTVKLEKLKYMLLKRLSSEFLADVEITPFASFLADEIYLRLKGYVWAEEESAQQQVIRYPYNWWQAFKEQWFPKWMLSRWPVKYAKVVLDVKAIYPNFRPAIPNQEMRLSIIRHDTVESE